MGNLGYFLLHSQSRNSILLKETMTGYKQYVCGVGWVPMGALVNDIDTLLMENDKIEIDKEYVKMAIEMIESKSKSVNINIPEQLGNQDISKIIEGYYITDLVTIQGFIYKVAYTLKLVNIKNDNIVIGVRVAAYVGLQGAPKNLIETVKEKSWKCIIEINRHDIELCKSNKKEDSLKDILKYKIKQVMCTLI